MKPQLAVDAILDQVHYPCYFQPKIDGVRALNLNGTLTGRSLDPFKGTGITEHFSRPEFLWLDGEMTLGNDPASADRLCAATTGAMGRFKGVDAMPDLHWWVFDYLKNPEQSYAQRHAQLVSLVQELNNPRIHVVAYQVCHNRADLNSWISWAFNSGYEGAIIRNPEAPYKEGRASKKGQELWRVKPWADAEVLVTSITEGAKNGNEAKKNSLGRTERSSAKAGMIPNGMVGAIHGTLLADFHDPFTGALLFSKGLEITIGPGEMTDEEAKHYWENPSEIVGKCVKFRHMTHGVKNLPRFPTYVSHRLLTDMS